MSETKHTPGPWKWVFSGTAGSWHLVDADGNSIRIAGPPDSRLTDDMRLMQSSPDMLAALERITEILTDLPAGRNYQEPIQAARAAIAKARGGA